VCAVGLTGFLVGAGPANAQAGSGRALRIEDFYALKTVGAPELSPDGRWVAYTLTTRVETNNDDASEVWIVETTGAPPRRVSPEGSDATAPRWDPDGRLRYTANGKSWLLDPASPERATEAPAARANGAGVAARGPAPVMSPDGRTVASLRNVAVPRPERVFASAFEKRHEERFKGVQFDWLDFQRDGQPFPVPNRADPTVSPPQEVFLSAPDGSGARQLTRLALRPNGLAWHPQGNALLLTADSGYRNELKYGSNEVYVVSTAGDVRKLTADRDYNYTNVSFSPDGRWVLATRQHSTDAVIAKRLDHGGPTDLVLISAEGGAERSLTTDWDYLPNGASWSPDGRYVYFSGGVGGTTHLFRVATSGGAVEQVTRGERRIGGISFDRGVTRMAYLVGLIEAPSEIYIANIDGTGERRLTSHHDDFTREVALSGAERLQFRSADGTPVEGWLIYPHRYSAGSGPYPLVVSNHGGPHAADGYSFDFKSQYFAANGYFVLKVNFRSSTGYGEKFLWGTWGGWGTKDGQDVMAGIDFAIARFPIDRRKVAAIGHSYGGFMTNWLITQYPDRFAAAIPGAGIVNWVSDYGTADIARTKETEFYGAPWDDRARDIMIKQSPLTYAHRVQAPTLFVHGEMDQRVPYSEAEQMYVALKKNGIPAKMIQYAGMAHGITGSWNQVHRMLNEMRWLDRYVKGVGVM
jgi:dipeptidyl aminopeptidase/acylaminoacyl peptidase